MNQIHLAQITATHSGIQELRQRIQDFSYKKLASPKEVRHLTGALRDLASTLDTIIKSERLIRNVPTEKTEITGNVTWKEIVFKTEEILNE
jgi:hypothetical protein